jgi:hypothetical protein
MTGGSCPLLHGGCRRGDESGFQFAVPQRWIYYSGNTVHRTVPMVPCCFLNASHTSRGIVRAVSVSSFTQLLAIHGRRHWITPTRVLDQLPCHQCPIDVSACMTRAHWRRSIALPPLPLDDRAIHQRCAPRTIAHRSVRTTWSGGYSFVPTEWARACRLLGLISSRATPVDPLWAMRWRTDGFARHSEAAHCANPTVT